MRSAFTLIELLVVVAIIGVLSAASIVALGALSSRSRDSSRRESLSAYATSLEQYKSSNGHYVVDQTLNSGESGGYIGVADVSLQGEGWGRMTRKGIGHYLSDYSIADILLQKGYLTTVQTDPTLKNTFAADVTLGSPIVTGIQPNAFTNDFFLIVCSYDGKTQVVHSSGTPADVDTTLANGVEFALYANLENPPTSGPNAVTDTSGQCGLALTTTIEPGVPHSPLFSQLKNSSPPGSAPFNYMIGLNLKGH